MKIYKSVVITFLSTLTVLGTLFGYVLQGYAQDDQDWTQPVNLSLSGIASNPMLVIDSDNSLHAIWVDKVDGYKYSQSANGVTWMKPQTVKYPFDKDGAPPVLLSDASGTIHVFWISKDAGLYYVMTTSSDITNPSSWQATNNRLAQNVVNYDVVLDAQGVLHLAYIKKVSTETTPAGIYYAQSIVGGGSWSGAINLYESDYFRSVTEDDSFIRIATSKTFPDQTIYVVWDSRPEKRVFMAVSSDSGLNWDEAQQIKGADDTGGLATPFNLNVAAVNNKVLLIWQVGEPGSAKCSVFSQWSENQGESWGNTVSVLGGRTDCPTSSKFIVQDEDYIIAMMNGQVEPTLIAWNGDQWSNPQVQTRLPAFSNPLTYDAILLGCRFDLVHQNRLYVIGCDQGGGGDIWFLSRLLDIVDNWFSFPKTWGVPTVMLNTSETVLSLSSASDSEGIVHSIWVQSSLTDDDKQKITVDYAQMEDEQLSRPETVISSLSGVPLQMSMFIDSQGRLLLAWIDGGSGDLLFSWSNLDRASLASEWRKPTVLPSPSELNSALDILADGSGRIVVVYTISVNENRGVYLVQSTDNGDSWTSSIRVFDAVTSGWEKIENPKISLSADGALHLIFSRASLRTGQPVGLYYSKSVDGGATWSDLQFLSEGDIRWSDVVSYGDNTVHVLWQEYDGLVFANLSQVSQDSGASWSRIYDVTGVNDSSAPVTLGDDGSGNLHFIQLLKNNNTSTINQDTLVLQDWEWTGSGWEIVSSSNLVLQGKGINYSLASDVTPTGFLSVSISAEYSNSDNEVENEILTFNRFLEESSILKEPIVALIPTPVVLFETTKVSDTLPTPPVDLSELNDSNIVTSSGLRDIAGLVVIVIAMVITVFLVIRGRNLFPKK